MSTLRADLARAPLGHATSYPDEYDPTLLFPVPRAPQRAELGITAALPFAGCDTWTAYEIAWLDDRGKPQIAVATLRIPVTSPALPESKSVKLYLGSFAQASFDSAADVSATVERDLTKIAGEAVSVQLVLPEDFGKLRIVELDGESLDGLDVDVDSYELSPDLLESGGPTVAETLTTDLFRSLCPVTGQPDYASVALRYQGPRIDRAALLRYLVSYRRHAGFHEHCVERIFVDVKDRCDCAALSVYARFTRRGGIEINPYRTDAGWVPPANERTARQ